MDNALSFILNNCPECIDLYQRIKKEYSFIFDEFDGHVAKCTADEYGCDIWINVKGVIIRFETAPRDRIEFGYDVSLPVDDPANKFNEFHSAITILDFMDSNSPPKYKGFDWYDNRINTAIQFKHALKRIVEFYNSIQFNEKSRNFNKWYDAYINEFRKSVEEYFKKH